MIGLRLLFVFSVSIADTTNKENKKYSLDTTCHMPNVNFKGHDILSGGFSTGNAEECQTECIKEKNLCRFWTWRSDTQQCRLKDQTAYVAYEPKPFNSDSCIKMCSTVNGCDSAYWDDLSQVCRYNRDKSFKLPLFISGPKYCPSCYKYGRRLEDKVFKVVGNETVQYKEVAFISGSWPDKCQWACQQESQCTHFYYDFQSQSCHLKSALEVGAEDINAMYGPKECETTRWSSWLSWSSTFCSKSFPIRVRSQSRLRVCLSDTELTSNKECVGKALDSKPCDGTQHLVSKTIILAVMAFVFNME